MDFLLNEWDLSDRLLAHYDTVTGLANRLTLYDRLSLELQRIKRHKTFAAILFIVIDDFKVVNDTFGHHCGDILLKEFTIRISSIVRAEDTFARLAGDEFVVLISNVPEDSTKAKQIAQEIANKVHKALENAFKIADDSTLLTVSIGIDIINENSQGIDDILRNADIAMYKSKKSGKAQTTLFA